MLRHRRHRFALRLGDWRPGAVGGVLAAVLCASLGTAGLAGGCGNASAPSPFDLFDPGIGGTGGAGASTGGSIVDAGDDADAGWGPPCQSNEDCADGVDCTFDQCDDTVHRCRNVPDDSTCQNGLFCDGVERCDPLAGCTFGPPVSCSAGNPCTIETCNEATKLCDSKPRDADGDGDPDMHCAGGHDCDDADPLVSSLQPEICGNGKDDNCDGQVDEADCVAPEHDTCLDPLELSAPGVYAMSTVGASLDYAASCSVSSPALARDVVAALLLAAGPPVDVQLTLRSSSNSSADVALALLGQCDEPASEMACSGGYPGDSGGRLAKIRVRGIGSADQALALPVYLFANQGVGLTLRYELLPASSAPDNETCGTAAPLTAGVPTVASLVGTASDVAIACGPSTGDLLYSFTLAQPQDVDLYATSVDGDGRPALSLRTAACALPEDEITCQMGSSPHVFRHSMPAGDYYVAVAASAPTDVSLTLELSPPTPTPADDSCATAPVLAPNQTIDVSLTGHQDDVSTGCIQGAVDAAYELDLDAPSDVLLLGRYSATDTAAVELERPACALPDDQLVCGSGQTSPVRGSARNLPAGSYRVVAESQIGSPMQITALVRPAVPPILVPFADTCADAQSIPSTGGFFQGNTANAGADYVAGCDQGSQGPGGAPEQMLKLVLDAPKRVVLDMQGSGYPTLLDVRQGPSCPGTEVPNGCAAGYYASRSFLDLQLAAGTYFLQVDGYASNSGPWFLDVRVIDP